MVQIAPLLKNKLLPELIDIVEDYYYVMRPCNSVRVEFWSILYRWINQVVMSLDVDNHVYLLSMFYIVHMKVYNLLRRFIFKENYQLFGICLLHFVDKTALVKNTKRLGIAEYICYVCGNAYTYLQVDEMMELINTTTPVLEQNLYRQITCVLNEACLASHTSHNFLMDIIATSVRRNDDFTCTLWKWICKLIMYHKVKIKITENWHGIGFYVRLITPGFPLTLLHDAGEQLQPSWGQ